MGPLEGSGGNFAGYGLHVRNQTGLYMQDRAATLGVEPVVVILVIVLPLTTHLVAPVGYNHII